MLEMEIERKKKEEQKKTEGEKGRVRQHIVVSVACLK